MSIVLRYTIILFVLHYANCQDEDYVYYSNIEVSYKFFKTPLKWLEAKKRCSEDGAKLAMPKDDVEALVLKAIFEKFPQSKLPNMHDKEHMLLDSHDLFREGDFITQGYGIQYFYHFWHPGQPNGGDHENCLAMNRNGNLHDASCVIAYTFICQKEKNPYLKKLKKASSAMRDPTYKYHSHSGKYFKYHMDVKDWPSAQVICHAEGGQLAIVESKQEEDFLVNMFNDPKNQYPLAINKNNALIGFHDLFEKGSYFTVDERKLENIGYLRWRAGEPNDRGNNERCGCITGTGELNDYPCTIPLQFFCEQSSDFKESVGKMCHDFCENLQNQVFQYIDYKRCSESSKCD